MIKTVTPGQYKGEVYISPSKSDAQRAILCAALADGISVLTNVGKSNDELAMIQNSLSLGATISRDENKVSITPNLRYSESLKLDVGESGLGVRLITPISAMISKDSVINGHGSLINRDLTFFERIFPTMGVQVELTGKSVPLQVKGQFKSGHYRIDGSESSQYISGLLMALPLAEGTSTLVIENMKSTPYIQMTLNTLKHFGITINREGNVFTVPGDQLYKSCDYAIDGDWSSASYWIVASALGLKINVKGLSMTSLQADKMLINALLQSNCRMINGTDGISIQGEQRIGLNFDATDCPDLFPALATYAVLTSGESKISGVHRLANKESNRAQALVTEFKKIGAKIEVVDDSIIVQGGIDLETPIEVDAHDDHRIAMCLAIAGMFRTATLTISGSESVKKSYPSFWEDLEGLRRG